MTFSWCMYLRLCDGLLGLCFFFKQKTAYEMRISDWSSDVCSSDLARRRAGGDKIARVQRDKLADVMHQMGYVEDHGAGIAILEAFPIDIKPHAQVDRKSVV